MMEDKTPLPEDSGEVSPAATENTGSNPAETSGKKKKKNKLRVAIFTCVEIVCLAIFAVAVFSLVQYYVEQERDRELSNESSNLATRSDGETNFNSTVNRDPKPLPSGGQEPIVPSDGADRSPVSPPYREDFTLDTLRYLVDKDLARLASSYKNPDICGWFKMCGYNDNTDRLTVCDQPVVQGVDDYYYLDYNVKRKEDVNGAVYLSVDNDRESLLNNRNMVLYAHARSYLKFGAVKSLNDSPEWAADERNHFIYYQTETETSIWRVFSWHIIDEDGDYRKTDFSSDEEFIAYCTRLQSLNKIPELKSYEFQKDDAIMTLSTCKGINTRNRVAVHAVLVAYAKLDELKK